MLDEIDTVQWMEWMVYMGLAPFGPERAAWEHASIVAAIVNMNRDPKKKPEPYPIDTFLLRMGDMEAAKKKPQTPEQMKAIGRMYFMAFNRSNRPNTRPPRMSPR
jgi:hypothetical protein